MRCAAGRLLGPPALGPCLKVRASCAAGESGNEAGYLVEMSTDTLAKPYFFKPGQIVRFESLYDWSQPYGGVMSQMRFIQFGMNLTNCEWLEYATMLSIPHNVTV